MGKQEPTFPNKHQTTITLKVLIHCEGCKRKVKRIIKCVDGVESVNIEGENGKVTVVGSGVDAKEVLLSLSKAGKHAEIWQFGGGKLPNVNQVPTNPNNNNNNNNANNNGEKNKMKAVAFEKMHENKNNNMQNPKGKGGDTSMNGGVNTSNMGGKAKGGGEMVELANFGPSFMVPPPKPPFPIGGFTPSGPFEKPNNVAILSKSVAPRPTVYHGESSLTHFDNSEYATADYATHLFSDENANNCSVM